MSNNLFLIPIIFFGLYFLLKDLKFLLRLIDKDFNKPQSFHSVPILRIGGLLIFITTTITYMVYSKNFFLNNFFIWLILANFLLGFLDDLKIVTSPFKKFMFFLIINFFIIYCYQIKILNFDNIVLDSINNSGNIPAYLLVLISLFFCINGSNLIDGFNGLLGIHSIIILSVLIFNFSYSETLDFKIYLLIFLLSLMSFLILNFPYSKIFLGDSGSLILGTVMAITIILASNENKNISAYYFAILIYYVSFEVFFSVFRKIFQKKNPFKPDSEHLHMLLFNYIFKKSLNYNFSNYFTSLLINIIYSASILPLIWIKYNSLACKIYFFILIIFYIVSYYLLKKLNGKTN
jgi:UDP-GlcNAc:undecaprenyl-phosphate/decaprenyl-phosphate GlcNAc-1-phosphate transferase